MTIPAESNWVPILIWFVVTPRSSVIVEVRAALILPRSIWRPKKARARMGMRMISILYTSQYMLEPIWQ